MTRRSKRPLDSQKKLELAQEIAKRSQSFKKTYESVEETFVKGFRSFSSWIDFILFNQRFSKLVALCLAIILFLVINGGNQEGSIFVSSVKQVITLENVKVVTNISESVYEVSGLPETVVVDVKGDTSDVQFASQQKDSYVVIADLEVFGEGTHEVKLEPMNFSDKVEVSIQPSTALVTIKKKISRSFAIGYDYINTDKMDKIYSLGEPEFSQNEVIVRASEDTISKIAFVKALIDVKDVKADFVQDAKLVAYDQNGAIINTNILPETVSVKVKVSTPHKEVPIEIVPEGQMSDGLAIESYTLDHSSITIYGAQKILDEIDKITINVPVNKITKDTTITMPVMLPNGISKSSISKVKISLKVGKAVTVKIPDVAITYKNFDDRFLIRFKNETGKTTVNVTGAKSVVENIKAEDISVVMDLEGYNKPVTDKVSLTVSGKNKLVTYRLNKEDESIEITLEEK